jgi:hypothetical protein
LARGAGLKTVVTVNDYTRDHDFREAAMPATVLAGPSLNGSCRLDLAALRKLHTA